MGRVSTRRMTAANGKETSKGVKVTVVTEVNESKRIKPMKVDYFDDEDTDLENQDEDEEEDDLEVRNPQDEGPEVDYFVAHSKRVKLSKASLKDLDLDFLQSNQEMDSNSDDCLVAKEELLAEYKDKYFAEWFFLMQEGFNVILFGVGSKRQVLDMFREEWLLDETHVVIFGMFQELTPRQILVSLMDILDCDKSDEKSIMDAVSDLEEDVFILIHSLDFMLCNNSKIKSLLIKLVETSVGKIHLLCSVDHVNSPLLWASHESVQLKWLWFESHTFASFKLERGLLTSGHLSSSIHSALSQYLTLTSVEHVYESLTPNAQQIFLIILNYSLEEAQNPLNNSLTENDSESEERPTTSSDDKKHQSDANLLPFSTLYRKCREAFLLHSEITLRSQLIEFTDHKLVQFRKASDGTESIALLIDSNTVKTFLDKVKE